MPLPREMTVMEQDEFSGYFPSLNVEGEIVTDEATSVYNCISWSVHWTDRWTWPRNSKASFDLFYAQLGYTPTKYGQISVFAKGDMIDCMTHGSRISFNGMFESKCGSNLRILHELKQVEGVLYGNVFEYYSGGKTNNTKPDMLKLTYYEKQKVRAGVLKTSKELRKQFIIRFVQWKKTWFSAEQILYSDPYTRAKGKEFENLVAMGTDILLLVIDILAEPDNFFAIGLYECLQQDARFHIKIRPESFEILQGEQSRAVRIIQKWLELTPQA